jgi:hypothetical protein
MPVTAIFGYMRWFYIALGGFLLLCLILNILAGIKLRTQRGRTFTLVVAAINCVHIPLGTILGVFTITVLLRKSVQQMYYHSTNPADPA